MKSCLQVHSAVGLDQPGVNFSQCHSCGLTDLMYKGVVDTGFTTWRLIQSYEWFILQSNHSCFQITVIKITQIPYTSTSVCT